MALRRLLINNTQAFRARPRIHRKEKGKQWGSVLPTRKPKFAPGTNKIWSKQTNKPEECRLALLPFYHCCCCRPRCKLHPINTHLRFLRFERRRRRSKSSPSVSKGCCSDGHYISRLSSFLLLLLFFFALCAASPTANIPLFREGPSEIKWL